MEKIWLRSYPQGVPEFINVDEFPKQAESYRIKKVPTFVVVIDGQEVLRDTGAQPLERIYKYFDMLHQASSAKPAAASLDGTKNASVAVVPIKHGNLHDVVFKLVRHYEHQATFGVNHKTRSVIVRCGPDMRAWYRGVGASSIAIHETASSPTPSARTTMLRIARLIHKKTKALLVEKQEPMRDTAVKRSRAKRADHRGADLGGVVRSIV